MVARGLLRHCPRCGGGRLFNSWFVLRERCPTCGLRFEREEGFWLGGYVINFVTGEIGLLVLLIVLIAAEANASQVNVWAFLIVGLVLAIVGPAVTFPFSRTIWSAADLIMRPLTSEELTAAQDAVARGAIDGPVASGAAPTGAVADEDRPS